MRVCTRLLIFLLIFSGTHVYGQLIEIEDKVVTQDYSIDWEVLKELDKVVVYYKYTDCPTVNDDMIEYVFLKIENLSDDKITFSGKLELGWKLSEGEPISRRQANKIELIIPAYESVEQGCGLQAGDLPLILVREKILPLRNYLAEMKINDCLER